MLKQVFFILIIKLYFLTLTFGQSATFTLDTAQDRLSIQNQDLLFLEDVRNEYSFTLVRRKNFQSKFKPLSKNERLASFTYYWAKFSIDNKLTTYTDWILSLGKLTYVDVYVPNKKGSYVLKRSGQFVPNSEKDIKTGRFNFVSLGLTPSEKVDIYIHFKNDTSFTPDLNLRVFNQNTWQDSLIRNNLFQGIFHGLLLMMLLYNLLLFFSFRDKAYLYYVLYTLSISIYFFNYYGYWGEFVMGDFPELNFLYVPFSVYLAYIFHFQFMRFYLQTHKDPNIWDTILKTTIILLTLAMLAMGALATVDYAQYFYYEKYVLLGIMAVMSLALLALLFSGDRVATFFALGTLCLVLGSVVLLLGALDIFHFKHNMLYFQAGVVLEVLIFSLGLSERHKATEKAKRASKEAYINQLKENQQLQTKVTRELEDKVKERTSQIQVQKEEIEAQRDEIEAQRDDIFAKNGTLEYQNRHIQDSINYASRIQSAMLDAPQNIEERLGQSFIFFSPKDIVSGDFYWYSEVQSTTEIKTKIEKSIPVGVYVSSYAQNGEDYESKIVNTTLKIMIAADCTGHGVPGAFMTVMGNAFLDDIINQSGIISPDRILYELDKKITDTLKQRGTDIHLHDGMDLSILVYDEAARIIHFAGAKNPLYLVRDFDIQQINASSASIGYSPYNTNKVFEKQSIEIREDDAFYMSSDGFPDQFGGEKNRKYMKKRFKQFLVNISHLPADKQKEKLSEELQLWKGEEAQTDDVLVVGLKF